MLIFIAHKTQNIRTVLYSNETYVKYGDKKPYK